jgi:hypothetical protein
MKSYCGIQEEETSMMLHSGFTESMKLILGGGRNKRSN